MAEKKRTAPRRARRKTVARPHATSTPTFEAFAVGLKPATPLAQRKLARSIARAAIPGASEVQFLQRDRSQGYGTA